MVYLLIIGTLLLSGTLTSAQPLGLFRPHNGLGFVLASTDRLEPDIKSSLEPLVQSNPKEMQALLESPERLGWVVSTFDRLDGSVFRNLSDPLERSERNKTIHMAIQATLKGQPVYIYDDLIDLKIEALDPSRLRCLLKQTLNVRTLIRIWQTRKVGERSDDHPPSFKATHTKKVLLRQKGYSPLLLVNENISQTIIQENPELGFEKLYTGDSISAHAAAAFAWKNSKLDGHELRRSIYFFLDDRSVALEYFLKFWYWHFNEEVPLFDSDNLIFHQQFVKTLPKDLAASSIVEDLRRANAVNLRVAELVRRGDSDGWFLSFRAGGYFMNNLQPSDY